MKTATLILTLAIASMSQAQDVAPFIAAEIQPYVTSVFGAVQVIEANQLWRQSVIVTRANGEKASKQITFAYSEGGFFILGTHHKDAAPALIEDDLLTQGAKKLAELIDSPDPVPGIGKVLSNALYVRHQGTSAVVLQLSFTDNTNGAYVAWIKSNGELGLYPAVL
ncbi:MAG TPA: hypothetical protein DCR55_00910 [Lentisphaeria bacterium]|nr:hypothetical protein [Lentisphaeria bacterium]